MNRLPISLCLAFAMLTLKCQTVVLKGLIRDARTREPLPFATIDLASTSDTSKYVAFTDTSGAFIFKDISRCRYRLRATYLDYYLYSKKRIRLSRGTTVLNIYMKQRPPRVCY